MNSRALDRAIADFRTLIEQHMARMIEAFNQRSRRTTPTEREILLRDALVLAFRDRDGYDPFDGSVTEWFGSCVNIAREEFVIPDEDELAMLKALEPETPVADTPKVTTTSIEHGKADPILKPGKDCP
jgi:exoribonuclease R